MKTPWKAVIVFERVECVFLSANDPELSAFRDGSLAIDGSEENEWIVHGYTQYTDGTQEGHFDSERRFGNNVNIYTGDFWDMLAKPVEEEMPDGTVRITIPACYDWVEEEGDEGYWVTKTAIV